MPADNEEALDQVTPSVDALRPHVGKVVAFDRAGAVLEVGDTWEQLIQKLGERLSADELSLMYVPRTAIVA